MLHIVRWCIFNYQLHIVIDYIHTHTGKKVGKISIKLLDFIVGFRIKVQYL